MNADHVWVRFGAYLCVKMWKSIKVKKGCGKIQNEVRLMTSEEVLLEKFKILPVNRKQELLDFAEFLTQKEDENNALIEKNIAAFAQSELQHLEMEFENYEQLYPRR